MFTNGNNRNFHRQMWSGIPVYIVADSTGHNARKMVAFIEEDVSCSTCRDVRFLVELNPKNEIVEIHFIEPFESYAERIPQKRMDKFRVQFLGIKITEFTDEYQPVAAATSPSRHFVLGLERLKQVLRENDQKRHSE